MSNLDAWKDEVKKKYPSLASKLKFKLKGKANEPQEISAEIDGQDRCYGVFDVKKDTGEVLGESMNDENIMKMYLEAMQPVDFEKQSDILTEGFMDWFKKNENESKIKVSRLTPEDVAKAAKDEDTPDIDFSIKDDIYAIHNESPIIDELVTMLGIPRDGSPYKIRTGYMCYIQKPRLLIFAKNKYDLPGFIGRRPKK